MRPKPAEKRAEAGVLIGDGSGGIDEERTEVLAGEEERSGGNKLGKTVRSVTAELADRGEGMHEGSQVAEDAGAYPLAAIVVEGGEILWSLGRLWEHARKQYRGARGRSRRLRLARRCQWRSRCDPPSRPDLTRGVPAGS